MSEYGETPAISLRADFICPHCDIRNENVTLDMDSVTFENEGSNWESYGPVRHFEFNAECPWCKRVVYVRIS